MKLMNKYEVILNRKSNATNKISDIELVKLMAKLSELVMI